MKKKTCIVCGHTKDSEKAFHSKRADCKTCRSKSERKTVPEDQIHTRFMNKLPDAPVYVVTYAQNATPVHKKFLAALLVYCKHNNAQLVVIPGRYKNPTSIWTEKMESDEWWASVLHPYLFDGRADVGRCTIYGDISIQPTAVRPLTGFEVFAGSNSAIFGHPKIQLHTVATAKRRYPRIFTTTGAVTKRNYTHSKAGKKGEAHHVYGATVVERAGDLFHVRQINALNDGTFIDLTTKYTPEGVEEAERALGLIYGDIHVDKSDPAVLNATYGGEDSIVRVLRPRNVFYHDLLDFDRRNHHRIHHFPDRYERALGGAPDNVEAEVHEAIAFIDDTTPADAQAYCIISNHDEAFDRWLNEANPKVDPINALFYHETWTKLLQYYNKNRCFVPALQLWYEELGAGKVKFISRDEPKKIKDIYLNFHGDKGTNGARGTTLQYAKLGVKTIIGHSHSPGILDGCYQVGVTGRLEMGYNAMPSSWLNTHAVIYANGKRSLIHVIEGEWRLKK